MILASWTLIHVSLSKTFSKFYTTLSLHTSPVGVVTSVIASAFNLCLLSMIYVYLWVRLKIKIQFKTVPIFPHVSRLFKMNLLLTIVTFCFDKKCSHLFTKHVIEHSKAVSFIYLKERKPINYASISLKLIILHLNT